jgi:putative transposase
VGEVTLCDKKEKPRNILPENLFELACEGIKTKKTSPGSPWQNGYAERFVRTARGTLDDMIIFGRRHFSHVLKKIEKHYNTQRPHQGIGNAVPLGYDPPEKSASFAEVECHEELGGMLRHYYKKAA